MRTQGDVASKRAAKLSSKKIKKTKKRGLQKAKTKTINRSPTRAATSATARRFAQLVIKESRLATLIYGSKLREWRAGTKLVLSDL